MSDLRITTVSSPAVNASAFTRGAFPVMTPIDGLNAPDMWIERLARRLMPAEPCARAV